MPFHPRLPGCAAALLLAAACVQPPVDRSRVVANDNRRAAGTMRGDTLELHLDIVQAMWYPEADSGPGVSVAVFAEAGKAPQVPGPLIRVPAGTAIAATVRNTLGDSTVSLVGLVPHPADSLALKGVMIRPGDSVVLRFAAGAPGTYLYTANPGHVVTEERQQLGGAFIVDSAGGRSDDRVFVINIWGHQLDSATYRNALAINGRAFPYNETIEATVGDTLRWRVVNASVRGHPMHLHGFYYRVLSVGDGLRDTIYAPLQRREVVTERMPPFGTMAMDWVPDRDGNWLFHCHIGFHVIPSEARLTSLTPADSMARHDAGAHDMRRHMAGLVLPITVRAGDWRAPSRASARALRLFVDEGRRRHRAPRAMGFVLQQGAAEPARDSVEPSGTTLVLTRGQPADITVINRLPQATAVHWHGIELVSASDGVVGWSGGDREAGAGGRAAAALAQPILPADSFIAHLTLPRAGTFIYHTHLNDLEQLTSGLYGAIVVLEPGQTFDAATDHVVLVGWDGTGDPPWLLLNGDSLPRPLTLAYGVAHRFRFINIGVAAQLDYSLSRGGRPVTWRRVAKDGADLPPAQAVEGPAVAHADVGETSDVLWTPPARGEYLLTVGYRVARAHRVQRVVVR